MNANPELDALLGRHAGVALDMAVWTSTAQRTASTTLRNSMIDAVAGALDDASTVHGDDRVDQVAAKCPEPRKRAVFVRAGEPAIAGDVGHKNCC